METVRRGVLAFVCYEQTGHMRILQVGNWDGVSGGVQHYIYDTAVAMSRAGHSVTVVSHGSGQEFCHHEGWREYPIPEISYMGKPANPEVAKRLVEVLDREKSDVAYVHDILDPGAASEVVNRLPTVFFNHVHTPYCPAGSKHLQRSGRICPHQVGAICFVQAFLERCQSRRPHILMRRYLRTRRAYHWLQRVDGIVVGSSDMKERLVAVGFKAELIAVLPYPVPVPERTTPHALTSQPPIVLFVGRLTPQKGLSYLLDAMRLSRLPYRLVVAGDGYEAGKCHALAQRLGVASQVDFLGWIGREKLASLYDACALAVVPSVWPEPFGMVGPEAMVHAKPVVAFDVGGIPDWLEHGVTGYLVPSMDVRQLAGRIDQLLADSELAQRMGTAGRAKALQLCGMESHLSRLTSLFGRVIKQRAEDCHP